MAETYRKSKIEKFQKHLQVDLKVMERTIDYLKREGSDYQSLITRYNILFDVLMDYCKEFDLELPHYPSYTFGQKHSKITESEAKLVIQEIINDVFHQEDPDVGIYRTNRFSAIMAEWVNEECDGVQVVEWQTDYARFDVEGRIVEIKYYVSGEAYDEGKWIIL